MLKKVKKSSYGLAIWVGIVCILHMVLFKYKVNYNYLAIQRVFIAFAAITFTLPIHELIHFVFFKMFSKSSVKIKAGKDPIGLPCLMTVYRDDLTKWQKVLSYIGHFVFLTLLVDVSFVFCTKVDLFFFVVAVCNSAGCYFDLIDVLIILQNKMSA